MNAIVGCCAQRPCGAWDAATSGPELVAKQERAHLRGVQVAEQPRVTSAADVTAAGARIASGARSFSGSGRGASLGRRVMDSCTLQCGGCEWQTVWCGT
jgi:hypothetical protein